MNRIISLVLLTVAASCGRQTSAELQLEPLGAIEVAAVDAGPPWCAAESQTCLTDGWEYDQPGHCCMARMTCFKKPGEATGLCAYSLWCADDGRPCLADGTERDVPGHCCSSRSTCGTGGCAP